MEAAVLQSQLAELTAEVRYKNAVIRPFSSYLTTETFDSPHAFCKHQMHTYVKL